MRQLHLRPAGIDHAQGLMINHLNLAIYPKRTTVLSLYSMLSSMLLIDISILSIFLSLYSILSSMQVESCCLTSLFCLYSCLFRNGAVQYLSFNALVVCACMV
jgi:hypothetical protein